MALGRTINIRKLAAIDIVFLGSKFILAEFAAGVLLSIPLGIFVLMRGRTFWQAVLGAYLICLGINYVPMFLYAVDISRKQSAHAEVADEVAADKRKAMSKYRRVSLLLLVPLVVPILAVSQRREG